MNRLFSLEREPTNRIFAYDRARALAMIGMLDYTAFIMGGVMLLEKRTRRLRNILAILVAISIPICAVVTYEYEGGEMITRYFTGKTPSPVANYFFLSQFYPVFPWFCFFLTGMLIGRLERAPAKGKYQIILVGSAILLIGAESLSALLRAETIAGRWVDIDMPWWRMLSLSEAFPAGPLFIFSASASSLALIAFLRLMPERHLASRHFSPLVAFGRLSLTFYISHIFICSAWAEWIFSLYGMASCDQALRFAAVFILGGMAFACWWMHHFQRGPLERGINWLIHAFLRLMVTGKRIYPVWRRHRNRAHAR